jgi:hypothetical protein
MKYKIYHTVGTFPKYNRKIVETGETRYLLHIIHDRSFT